MIARIVSLVAASALASVALTGCSNDAPLTLQLRTGASFDVSGSWELIEWEVRIFDENNEDILVAISDAGSSGRYSDAYDCAAAASCAQTFASLYDHFDSTVAEETVGDVTYFKVNIYDHDSRLWLQMWYLDWDGQTYQLEVRVPHGDSRPGESLEDVPGIIALVESIDWTGGQGAAVGLPHGLQIGVSTDWKVRERLDLAPIGGPDNHAVSVITTSCSSAATCEEYGDYLAPNPTRTRTLNGVTYYLVSWLSEDGSLSDGDTWYCEREGHVYAFSGSREPLASLMPLVQWIAG